MITFLSIASDKKENKLLEREIRLQAADQTEEYWNYYFTEAFPELAEILKDKPVLDLCCWDLTMKNSLNQLMGVRKEYAETQLLLMADATISPMTYLKPSILPSGLLMKPLNAAQVRQVFEEAVRHYVETHTEETAADLMVINSREGTQYVPYSQIYYIEAREKKIFVHTYKEEYGFYDTIENVAEMLPEYFFRCHRSFIANRKKVDKVLLSQNMIQMQEGVIVPLSRSYKKAVKDLGGNGNAKD